MARNVDYYFAPQSPWTYLGHQRLTDIVLAKGAKVRLLPVDLGGKVFPISGGLPLSKRAPQRQAYRLLELRRYSEFLNAPLNLHPKFFPVSGDDAARLIIAVELEDGVSAGMKIAGAILSAVWSQEKNIADAAVLYQLLEDCGIDRKRMDKSCTQAVQERYEANTEEAIKVGVFGAPSYVIEGEIFWGQDRLDFVERKLNAN